LINRSYAIWMPSVFMFSGAGRQARHAALWAEWHQHPEVANQAGRTRH
jgi:hypothetical protein